MKYFTLGTIEARTGTRGDIRRRAHRLGDRLPGREQLLPRDARRASDSSARKLELRVLRSPRYNIAIARINGLQGEARRRGWAALDAEMMRDDPPWATFQNEARADLVSEELGCYVLQPVVGRLNFVAACKK